MDEGKTEEKAIKKKKYVMAMCCPEGEEAEKIKEKILLKLGRQGQRGDDPAERRGPEADRRPCRGGSIQEQV